MPIKRRLSLKTMEKARAGTHKKVKPDPAKGFFKEQVPFFARSGRILKEWDSAGIRSTVRKTIPLSKKTTLATKKDFTMFGRKKKKVTTITTKY